MGGFFYWQNRMGIRTDFNATAQWGCYGHQFKNWWQPYFSPVAKRQSNPSSSARGDSGHFLARGRIHGFSAASRRFVDGNPSSDTVYEKPLVQKLVATLLFAIGEKAIQALIRSPQQAEKLEFIDFVELIIYNG